MRSLALLLLLFPLGLKGGGSPGRPASLRGFQMHASYFTFRALSVDKNRMHCIRRFHCMGGAATSAIKTTKPECCQQAGLSEACSASAAAYADNAGKMGKMHCSGRSTRPLPSSR